MSNPSPSWVSLALTAARQNKKVLGVEGKGDVAVYREWIGRRLGPTWTNLLHLQNAEDRPRLLAGLRWLQENNHPLKTMIFGLVDRDEWEPADIAGWAVRLPTLLVNQDRHSLESYFCDPDEIEAILKAQDALSGADSFVKHLPALRQQLENARHDYVPHWALGCVIQRANERVRNDEHYPAFFRNTCPLPRDEDVRAKLQAWANMLAPATLFSAFDALRHTSLGRPVTEQFRSCVEPKLFFGNVVVSGPHGLNAVRRQESSDWLIELARWSPAMPTDLEATLAPVLI